jgi:hypothetical protein
VAPPRDDLRVFIRSDPDSSSWTRVNYTIRTHVAGRLGIDLARVPQASRTKTGWSVRATDIATRNLIIQRQSEWIGDSANLYVAVGRHGVVSLTRHANIGHVQAVFITQTKCKATAFQATLSDRGCAKWLEH